MKKVLFLAAILAAAVSNVGLAQSGPSAENGKTIYNKWCVPCHGAVAPAEFGGALPGTAALSVKYKGRLPAVLEERTDLVPEFVKAVVRGGLFGMPITRKTEISDAQLEDVSAYLARKR